MKELNSFLEKVLSNNYNTSLYKYVYLYNEVFISIYDKEDFVLL
jgi:hypothetical protein